jgi:hypothetical protein
MRDGLLQTIAGRLGLGADARRRLGKPCAEYEPKFRGLVAPKQPSWRKTRRWCSFS